MASRHKRILVFRIGHLGDTIVALPAFWEIRNRFPSANIALLSNSDPLNPNYVSASSVIPEHGLFDETISYPATTGGISYYFEMIKLARKIRRFAPDTVFYLMPRIRTLKQIRRDELFFKLGGVKSLIGADHLRQNRLPARAEYPAREINSEADHLLRSLGFDEPDLEKGSDDLLRLNENELAVGRDLIEQSVSSGADPVRIIAVAPGSKWGSKVWAEENYRETVQHLIDEFDIFPIVFGGPEDAEKGERLIRDWGRGLCAAGKLNVRESAAAMKICKLYLGNDTGTMHLAAAVGTKCVAIFAAVDYPGRWYPFGSGHKIFREQVSCEGCQTPLCFNDHLCLEKIQIGSVLAGCREILA